MTKVFIGMSGGVDSSVAAYLLKSKGFDVTGVFMNNWSSECSNKDLQDFLHVTEILGIEAKVLDLSDDYKRLVFNDFLSNYSAGNTPNPDVLCNQHIKFGAFMDYALKMGADFIATGHYASIKMISSRPMLLRSRDLTKDQTYFLYRVTEQALYKTIFPLSEFLKSEVRDIAKKLKLPVADKRDSMGICFIGKRNFDEFIDNYIDNNPGPIYTDKSVYMGEHRGLCHHTIGQRKGIKIGGLGGLSKHLPWYVFDKSVTTNTLYITQGSDSPMLLRSCVYIKHCNWINNEPDNSNTYICQIRHLGKKLLSRIYKISSKIYYLEFEVQQKGVASGQSIVLYNEDVCIGGGIIL